MIYDKNIDAKAHLGAGYEWLNKWISPYVRSKKILDVGCWSGVLEKLLSRIGCDLTGIDIEKEAIEAAQKAFPKFKFVEADILGDLPFSKNTFDVVLFLMTIEHLPKGTELGALKNINKVLKPEGALFLSTMNNQIISNLFDPLYFFGHRHYDLNNLKALLSKSGFRIGEVRIHGGFSIIIYTLFFYFYKHIFKKVFFNKLIDSWMAHEYSDGGFMEIKIRARKTRNI